MAAAILSPSGRIAGRESGGHLWLRMAPVDDAALRAASRASAAAIVVSTASPTGRVIAAELQRGLGALLGVDVPLAAALVVETSIIVVRSVAVPVPAGLGVQDVGYVLCLKALGVAEATTVGTAFVLLKRGKDLFWILLGFALMAIGKRDAGASGEAPKT